MKEKVIVASIVVVLFAIVFALHGVLYDMARPQPDTKEPFTIVCNVGNKEESFAVVDYFIDNSGACTFTTDDGRKIVTSHYIIFVDEPYYKEYKE